MTDYPRVLFITPHAFNHLTGGGVTFSNLFQGWPKEYLATIHDDIVPTSDDVCDQYYFLGPEEIDLAEPLRSLRKWRNKGNQNNATTRKKNTEAGKEQVSRGGGMVSRLLGDSVPQKAVLSPSLEKWIADFKPDVIYTILGNNGYLSLIEKIKKRFSLPHVIHFMDDWPDSAYKSGVFAASQNRLMRKKLKTLSSSAAVRMGICDAMCEAFSNRYAPGFIPFQNTVDIDKWAPLCRKSSKHIEEAHTLLYVGSIFANAQLTSLVECAEQVVKFSEAGKNMIFEIASPTFLIEPVRHLFPDHEAVRFIDPIDDDEAFYKKISHAGALLLPVNFDEISTRFIKFSMPTKVSAYLASGTPVLVYGPEGLAQISYAQDCQWGHVVAQHNADALAKALVEIFEDVQLRDRLMTTSQKIARERHDASVVRTQFRAALFNAANQ